MTHQNTFRIIFFILTVALFTACSKQSDTDANNAPAISITGKWYNVKDTITYYTYATNKQESQQTYAYNRTIYTQYNADKTGAFQSLDINNSNIIRTETFSYVLNSDGTVVFNVPAQIVNGAAQGAYSFTYKIRILTNDALVFDYNGYGVQPGNARYAKEAHYFAK